MVNNTTQQFVPIKEVRDGVAILHDGSMKALLLVSSINFALKSEDEQTAIITQFQNFLNSIDFSIQIFIQSRRLDIRPYVALLENRKKEQTNFLLKEQINEYIDFIKTINDTNNIMTKSFIITVPYTPSNISSINTKNIIPVKKSSNQDNKKTDNFEENRTQLEQRVSVVEQGILRCGLRSVQLGTEEVIEVFYKLFNPGDTEKPIPNV